MCQHGQKVMCNVWICADDSHTGHGRWVKKGIDSCLASLVNLLNATGKLTRSCCCGHGKTEGTIILHNGEVISLKNINI